MIRDTGHRFLHVMLGKPDFLRTNMLPDKTGTGHAADKHTGKNYIQLIDRKFEKKTDGTERPACSSFQSYGILQQNVVNCILKNEDRLDQFLRQSRDGDRIKFRTVISQKNNWGTVVCQNQETGQLESGLSNDITVVLLKDEKRDLGFSTVTAYSDADCIQEKNTDLTPYIDKTKTWQAASAPRKLRLWRMAEPDPCYNITYHGSSRVSIRDNKSSLRCDFAANGTYFSRVDENGNPKEYGMDKNKKSPYASIEREKLQNFLQKHHPDFFRAAQRMNNIYRTCIPVKPKIPERTAFERLQEKNNSLQDTYGSEQNRSSPAGD